MQASFFLYSQNSMDASRRWGPTRWGGAYAPYKCFRQGRKPWRRANLLRPSILITGGWRRPLAAETQKERHLQYADVFLFGTPEGTRTPNIQNRNLTLYPLNYGRIS